MRWLVCGALLAGAVLLSWNLLSNESSRRTNRSSVDAPNAEQRADADSRDQPGETLLGSFVGQIESPIPHPGHALATVSSGGRVIHESNVGEGRFRIRFPWHAGVRTNLVLTVPGCASMRFESTTQHHDCGVVAFQSAAVYGGEVRNGQDPVAGALVEMRRDTLTVVSTGATDAAGTLCVDRGRVVLQRVVDPHHERALHRGRAPHERPAPLGAGGLARRGEDPGQVRERDPARVSRRVRGTGHGHRRRPSFPRRSRIRRVAPDGSHGKDVVCVAAGHTPPPDEPGARR